MKVLGIDYGKRRIGVAVGDTETFMAFPLEVLDARQSLKAQFRVLLEKRPAEQIIVGNPLNLKGDAAVMSEKVARFANKLETWFGVTCVLWDERFTSVQADSALHNSKNKGDRDMAAATLILQSYLDYLSQSRES